MEHDEARQFAMELADLMDKHGIEQLEYCGWGDTIGGDKDGIRFSLGRDGITPETIRNKPPEYAPKITYCGKGSCYGPPDNMANAIITLSHELGKQAINKTSQRSLEHALSLAVGWKQENNQRNKQHRELPPMGYLKVTDETYL